MNFERLAAGIDVAPLRAALDANPALWQQITIRQSYPGTAHGDTETIFLRGPEAFTAEAYQGTTTATDYPALDQLPLAVRVLLCQVLTALRVKELGYVLVVKLKPHGVVTEHIDEGAYAEHYQRFHLAVTGEEGAVLVVNGERQHFAPGEVWRFDHRSPHSAENNADTARIHVIFDALLE